MLYLDTSALVKLYYPEGDSARVVELVQSKQVAYTPLHHLELVNALQLKVFMKTAKPAQVTACLRLVEEDLAEGTLLRTPCDWDDIYQQAAEIALQHTKGLGCRSLDILHVAVARVAEASAFLSADARQVGLARAVGLRIVPLG